MLRYGKTLWNKQGKKEEGFFGKTQNGKKSKRLNKVKWTQFQQLPPRGKWSNTFIHSTNIYRIPAGYQALILPLSRQTWTWQTKFLFSWDIYCLVIHLLAHTIFKVLSRCSQLTSPSCSSSSTQLFNFSGCAFKKKVWNSRVPFSQPNIQKSGDDSQDFCLNEKHSDTRHQPCRALEEFFSSREAIQGLYGLIYENQAALFTLCGY